ncbi:MAG: zf-HC2 domain-containing protein [Mycobacterium sp.]|nr:zf-HC2 domain-containing protein [Mycobacterium sp.]
MMTLWGPSPPDGEERAMGQSSGDHEYAMWDAAYVLGSLSPTDRREFEAHMGACPSCRNAVAELGGMPALLSQLDRDELAAMDSETDQADRNGGEPSLPPELLPSLLAKVSRRRHRSRLMTWTAGAAAAVVLAISVFVGIHGHLSTSAPVPPQASVLTQSMNQVGTTALASSFSLSSKSWGTVVDMKCVCLAPINARHDRLAMVVVGRDGSRTRLATWTAEPGHTATPAGSISTPVTQIAALQVVLADNDRLLLERSL